MKPLRWITLITLIAVSFYPFFAFAEAPPKPPALVVTTTVQQKAVAKTLDVVGTLQFERFTHLSPEVSGKVRKVLIKEGDRVKKGDPLFRLNLDFVENEINTVQKQIAQIDVRLTQAKKDLTRYEALFAQEAASEQEFDNMRLSMNDLECQKATLEEKLQLATLKKRKSTIRAPFNGVILEKIADKGSWVAPGSQLCLLGGTDDLYVKVPMAENLLGFSTSGKSVSVSIRALGKTLQGTIAGFIPVADAATKTIFVKVKLPALETTVLNMSATVAMPAGKASTMTMIPRTAIVTHQGQNLAYTIKEGKAAPLPVTIVSYVDKAAAIAPGPLKPGMLVVIDGNDRLKPGDSVQIIPGKK